MAKPNDLSRSLVALDQDSTLVAVIEMSQSAWLVAACVPGVERRPLQKLPPDPARLHQQLLRWRDEAVRAGRRIDRLCVAYEAGRDGFWLARWLRARGIEAQVIHPSSIAVSREQRRAKTDRLDTGLLLRAFLGWLRGEPDHCRMAAVPSLDEEDGRRPHRERDHLVAERTAVVNRIKGIMACLGIRGFAPADRRAGERLAELRTPTGEPIPPNTQDEVRRALRHLEFLEAQIEEVERSRLERLERAPDEPSHAMVRLLAKVNGVGIETADMLVHEVLSRNLRDRRAVARFVGLTGTPDESGARRRERGIGKGGNARVRKGMIQLAWRFLMFQPDSDLAKWYRARTAAAKGGGKLRKIMIVALARKILVALWSMATTGAVPGGLVLKAG
jgi:transposase